MIKVQKKCQHCPSVSWRPSNSVSVLHVVIHGPTNLPAYFQALDFQPISQPTSKAIFQPTPKATFQPTSLHAWRNLNLLAGRFRQPWRRGRRNATTWEAESARISTSCCRLLSPFQMHKSMHFAPGVSDKISTSYDTWLPSTCGGLSMPVRAHGRVRASCPPCSFCRLLNSRFIFWGSIDSHPNCLAIVPLPQFN